MEWGLKFVLDWNLLGHVCSLVAFFNVSENKLQKWLSMKVPDKVMNWRWLKNKEMSLNWT